jgi:hypothetical protein
LRRPVEQGVLRPQVVVKVLNQTIPIQVHVQLLRHFSSINYNLTPFIKFI